MIVITGAAGFIGSYLARKLNEERFFDLVLVDDFSRTDKSRNHQDLTATARIDREAFPAWLDENQAQVQFIFHLGARTDTTEQNKHIMACCGTTPWLWTCIQPFRTKHTTAKVYL